MTPLQATLCLCIVLVLAAHSILAERTVREIQEELVFKTEVIEVQHQVDLRKTQLLNQLADALLRCSAAYRPKYFVADKLPPELEIHAD